MEKRSGWDAPIAHGVSKVLVAFLTVLCVAALLPGIAHPQEAPVADDSERLSAEEDLRSTRLEELAARRAAAAESVSAAGVELLEARKALDVSAQQTNLTEQELATVEERVSAGRTSMRSAAVDAFMAGGATATTGRAAWSDVIAGQVRADQFSAAAVEGLGRRLDAVIDERDRLRTVLEEARTHGAELAGRVAAAEAAVTLAEEHLRAVSALEEVSTELSRSGFDVSAEGGLTLMGNAAVSAADMAAYVRANGSPHPSIDIEALAALYLEEGRAEGIRGDVAFVQSILETGWFSFRNSMVAVTDNNYAGIGACDSCSDGYWYPTARDGVRAQMQLLRIYAEPDLRSDDLAHPPVRSAPERVSARGCCDTWAGLTGVWATADGYGTRILEIYAEMAVHRAQT